MRPPTQAGDLGLLRGINERAVLTALREGGGWRASEIATRTGLTRASVVDVLVSLQRKGWVEVDSPVAAGRGRPAQQYRFRQLAGYVLGVDVGAHAVRARLADLSGAVHASSSRPVDPEVPRLERIAEMERAVEECLSASGVSRDDVWVSLVGTTGIVDTDTGIVVKAVAIPDWSEFDLGAALRDRLPGRVYVDNDLSLSAMAELRAGAGRGMSDVLFLHAGYRIGIRVFVDGQPLRGHHSLSGELSRVRLPIGAESADDDTPSNEIRDVAALVTEGDADGLERMTAITRDLAQLAGLAAAVVDPQAIILSGPLVTHGEVVLPVMRAGAEKYCFRPPTVAVSQLGAESVVIGAVMAALQRLDEVLLEDELARVPQLSLPAAEA